MEHKKKYHAIFAFMAEKCLYLQTECNTACMDKGLKIRDWVLGLPKRGRYTFSNEDIFKQYPSSKKEAVSSALKRLVKNGKIQSVWHGFYVVVPVEYELKGVVPPVVYIDQLMAYLQKDYYIGLLNAASFYGAAHQQPQEFTVIVGGASLRDKFKNGVKINFATKKEIPHNLIQKRISQTGYISLSSPELTAFDLLLYLGEVGSLSRACTVLNELVDEMDFGKITPDFLRLFPVAIIQRFGYILDEVLERADKAKVFMSKVTQTGIKFRKTPLKPNVQSGKLSGYEQNKIWKIVINEKIEIDE
jgi:predicted transcriptional regulator of viral defense system